MTQLNPDPPKQLLSWAYSYAGEPRKRQAWAQVTFWLPMRATAGGIESIASYLHTELNVKIARWSGWSQAGSHLEEPDELVRITVNTLRSTLPHA